MDTPEKTTKNESRSRVIVFVLLTGFSVGVLAGLSVSPVAKAIITSILGLVSTATAALAGLKITNVQVDFKPIACLLFALVIGVGAGIFVRSYELLGPSLRKSVEKWSGFDELPQEYVVRRIFDSQYPVYEPRGPQPPTGRETVEIVRSDLNAPVLFGYVSDEIKLLLVEGNDDTFRKRMENSDYRLFRKMEEEISDTEALRTTVKLLYELLFERKQ